MPPKGTSGVYRITNTVTGDSYIGSSNDIRRRWTEHCHRLTRGTHDNSYLQRAIVKYGSAAFTIAVLEVCAVDMLITVEQRHMDAGRPTYNMAPKAGQGPGMAGKRHSEATLEKLRQVAFTEERRANLSAAHSGRWTPERRTRQAAYAANMQTPESIARRSEAHRGHPVSAETRQKIAAANVGRVHRPHSEETRRKMSESQKLAVKKRPPISEATRKKMADGSRGKKRGPVSEETREKIRRALTGRKLTDGQRAKISQSNRNRPPISDETRARRSASLMGRVMSPEARAKISAARKQYWVNRKSVDNQDSLTLS